MTGPLLRRFALRVAGSFVVFAMVLVAAVPSAVSATATAVTSHQASGAGQTAGEPPSPPASLPPVEEKTLAVDARLQALADIRQYLQQLQTMQAGFVQRAPDGTLTKGDFYLQRPGRVRFDYTDNTPFLVVADGEILSFIDYEVGQVTRWPVADTPLRLLLSDSVDLAALGASIELNPGGMQGFVALSARDQERPEVGIVTLFFRRGDAAGAVELVSWMVRDASDAITIVDLQDITVNEPLEKKLWSFDDPRGAARRRR